MSQDQLFPDEGAEYVQLQTDQVDELIPGWSKFAIMPDKKSVDSVRRFGVLQPILLIQNEDGKTYQMAAGRRRIRAAVMAERKVIDARVFPHGWTQAGVLTLVENENRRRNPLSEWQAVEELLASGMKEQDILDETGVPKAVYDKLLSLRKLIEPLQVAFKAGKIKSSVAFKAAKYKTKVQKAIAKYLTENGRIRVADVGKVRKAVLNDAVASLPFEVFNDTSGGWKENVLNTLSRLRGEIKGSAPVAIIDMLDVVMKESQRVVVGKVVPV